MEIKHCMLCGKRIRPEDAVERSKVYVFRSSKNEQDFCVYICTNCDKKSYYTINSNLVRNDPRLGKKVLSSEGAVKILEGAELGILRGVGTVLGIACPLATVAGGFHRESLLRKIEGYAEMLADKEAQPVKSRKINLS